MKYKKGTKVLIDLNSDENKFGTIIGYRTPCYKVKRYNKIYSIHYSNILTKSFIYKCDQLSKR